MGADAGGAGAGATGQRPSEPDAPRADVAVCGGVPVSRRKWRHVGGRKVRAMAKLDESKVGWIVSQKRKGAMTSAQIA